MFMVAKYFTNNRTGKVYIDCNKISFGWQLESDKNNVYQKSYRIIIYNEQKKVIYDTGKVNSSQQFNIYYNDINFESKKEYYWKVIVWNNYDEVAESELISFETGFLRTEDWKAKWIEANIPIQSTKEEFDINKIFSYHPDINEIENIKLDPPITFEKDFIIENKEIKKARIYITAHGIYEAKINSIVISDEYFNPGFSSYSKLLYYQIFDISNQINKGKNNISITVADGWYKGRIGLAGIGHQFGDNVALLAQIEIEYIDGERQIIGTDNSFKAFTGEIEYSDLFIGEKHNYANESINYYEVIEKNYGYDNLKLDIAEPVRCIEKLKPEKIILTPKGETVIDFGRNIAGIVEVKVKGNKGDIVKLQHAEELDHEGNFFFNILGQNKYQTDIYILKGGEEETLIPKFTYHGFRYVKVINYPGKINKDNFTAYVLSSDIERAGKITTSNPKINKLLQNIYHSQQSNFISIPTDCPQREKGGWTGDAQIFIQTAIFNMKIDNFMKRWLKNMKADQYENGQIPVITPWIESDNILSNSFGNISSAGWSDACIIIPWYLYVYYEDINFLKDNYDMMKKWIRYVEERCASNITKDSKDYERYIWNRDFHYGDWYIPSIVDENGKTDPMKSAKLTANQVATIYFAYSSELISKIANIIGEKDDAIYYLNLSKNIKDAFIKAYVDAEGKILNDLQGLYALAAYFKMGDYKINKKFADRLAKKIIENGNKLDTGFLSTPIILDILINYGKKDLAYNLLLQEECPSWLYMVNKGSTTIWESWNAIEPDNTRNIISFNHYALGSVQNFIVRRIIGLNKLVTNSHNGSKFVIEPDIEAPFEYCSLSYMSQYGEIYIEWDKRYLELNIKVPIGTAIILKLPNKDIIELGSGDYKINI